MSKNIVCRPARRSVRLIVVLLLLSFLVNTTFAAPESTKTVLVSVNELRQDIRFGLGAINLSSAISNWTNPFFLLFAGRRASEAQVTRIEILPGGEVRRRQGEPINFTAIGYSSNGQRIGGLRFDWTVEDTGRQQTARNIPDGVFRAAMTGTFVIRARANGVQAQTTLTVEENEPLMMMRLLQQQQASGNLTLTNLLRSQGRYNSGNISSKLNYRGVINVTRPGGDETETDDPQAKSQARGPNAGEVVEKAPKTNPSAMMRPADEDGWNNNNWWEADDPGNSIGNPPGSSPDAGAGNGNFQLSAPVVSLPGRGIDVSLSLNYNSRVWSKGGNVMSFDAERGSPAPGWNLGFGKMMFMGTSGGCMLIDADGTHRGYTGTISNYGSGNNWSSFFTGYTTDGTFTDYQCYVSTINGVTTTGGSSRLPNGTFIRYENSSVSGKQAFPTLISDAQGNYINVTYRNYSGPQLQTITDTLGRVITFNYDSLNRLISVDVPRMNNSGTRTAVRLHYKQLTLNAGWAYPVTGDTNNANPYVIDAIYYPGTGTGYWFNDSDSYSSYGMISKVIEQRGMSWSGSAGDQGTVTAGTMSKQAVYNYPLSPVYTLTDAPTYSTLTETWAGMDTSAAVTNYSVNMNASPRTVTVTKPNGVKSKQYIYNASGLWNDGLIYQDETLDTSNNVLSKSVVTWGQGAYSSPRPTQTEITDEKQQTLKTTYDYGTLYNQVISQKQYDYDGTTLLKESRNTYENNSAYTSRHIFSLVKSAEIYDGIGTRVSKTDYEYDYNSVVNGTGNPNLKGTPGVTMHMSSSDPFTTETADGPNCIDWQPNPYDPGSYWCAAYEQVSVYDQNSVFRGNVTKTTGYSDAAAPSGSVVQTKQYDITGNLVSESASCCELKSYDFTSTTQYAYPTTFTRGSSDTNSTLKNTATAVYDFNTGLITQSTDENGRTGSTTFNADTLRPSGSTSPTGAYSQIAYDESAMTVTDETKESGGATASKSITYLNGLGLTKRVDSVGPSSITDIVETKYNELAQVWKQSRPYRSGDAVQWSEKFYDIQGRLIKIVDPNGSETKAFYNETPRPDSASTSAGATIRVTDAWGRERWGRYDALERLAEVVEPNPAGNGLVSVSGSLKTSYIYNTVGQLIESNQGGQLRKFKYDSLGRITRQKLAEQSATLNDLGQYVGENGSGATWSTSVIYDNRSNITQRTDPRGVKINYSYQLGGGDDPLNRIQSVGYDLSGPRDTSKPIGTAPTVTYEYMTTGDQSRIKKVRTSGFLTEDFAYDTEGRVKDYTQKVDAREDYPWVTSYTYDTLDRITQTRYPAAYGLAGSPRKLVENTFDSSSRLSSLKVDSQEVAGNIAYNAADQTTQIKIGTAGTNQVTENYSFDQQTGLLTGQTAVRNGTTLLDLSYDYARNNSNGNLNGKTGHLTKILNNLDHTKDREYQFDAVGRLTVAKGKATGQWTQTYVYDRYGNRTSVAATGTAADSSTMPTDGIPTLAYDTANNRITTSGYEYDVAGNQTRALAEDGTTWVRYEYDAANRLQVVKKDDANQTLLQVFQFGSTNARLIDYDATQGQNKFYAAVNGTVLTEFTEYAHAVPTWTKSFTYLGDSQLSTVTPNGSGGETVEYNHPDRLGTRLITNQATGGNSEQAHLPFGRPLDAESSVTNNTKRFTSYNRSSVTKLDDAINRTYDSKQGRFTQVDPIGMGASSLATPQTLNLYSYCGNDPINHVDPEGLFWGSLFRWIGRIIRAIVVALAVAVAIVAIFFPPTGIGAWGIAKLLIASGAAIASAFAPPKIGAIIGLAVGIVLGGPGIIVNLAETASKMSMFQRLLVGANFVGAIANSLTAGKPKKKRPGLFQTVDQAARYWLGLMNSWSFLMNREVAVPICERNSDGKIIFGPQHIGTIDGSIVKNCPTGTKRVGSAHTHGAYDPDYDSENFSPEDRINANNRSLTDGGSTPNYIGTPRGGIKKFIPAAIKGSKRGKVIVLKRPGF